MPEWITRPRRSRGRTTVVLVSISIVFSLVPFVPASAIHQTIAISDAVRVEANSGTASMVFTVTRTGSGTDHVVTVNFATANGTNDGTSNDGIATEPSDYTPASGTLTFLAGDAQENVSVPIKGDTSAEPNEVFFVNLTSPTLSTISDGQGVGTITNDDDLPPTLSVDDVVVDEGGVSATFTITLSPASDQTVTLTAGTADETAASSSDYTGGSGPVSFNPGDTTKTATAAITQDSLDEPDETFILKLTDTANAGFGDSVGVATITDDDSPPALGINDVSPNEGDPAAFTVTLSSASGQTVTVDFGTANGTALAASDYTTTSGTLTFSPGDTSEPVSVPTQEDASAESNETFFVNLSNPGNAAISDPQGVGTIINDDGVPSLSIDDVTVTEGNPPESTTAAFTVTLSAASGQEVTVDFATADGTAVSGSDYSEVTGTLTFAPGDTTKTINVPVEGDTANEVNETFTVNLSLATNASISDPQGAGTINNDDGVPSISIGDVTVTEGNPPGSTTAQFAVSLSEASGKVITVDFATADGTAISTSDYTANSGFVRFDPGDQTKTVNFTVTRDTTNEANETFFVDLSAPTNATIADSQGQGTINNDDAVPSISINDVAVTEGNPPGSTTATFTVSLSAASGQTVTVDFGTANGTAVAGSDYTTATGTATFNPGDTSKTVTVSVIRDTTDEPNETFTVNLSLPTNATIADPQGVGTINDDDPAPSISVNDAAGPEDDSGSSNFTFQVSLSTASGQTITVNFATSNDTATAGSDYTTATGTVTFAPGDTTKTFNVAVSGDTLNEADETFFVNLTNPSGGSTLADGQGAGTIQNDDPVTAELSIDNAVVVEGNPPGSSTATFTVTLDEVSGQDVTVDFGTANGSAVAGSDYSPKSGSLTFAPGDTTKTIQVTVFRDTLDEPNETFLVNLSGAENASISDPQGVATINDDDPATATLSINDFAQPEGNSGTTNFVFTVTRSGTSGQTITVNYSTSDGTATAGFDYTTTSGTLTFVPGDSSETIAVPVFGEVIPEPNETFFVNLSLAQNATISDSSGRGTVNNDDGPAPSLSINDVAVTEGNPPGSSTAAFTVTLSSAASQTVTVDFATVNGTATAGSDFTSSSGTLTFAPGDTTETVNVSVTRDTLNEADETFVVNLSNSSNATISDSSGQGTINNDDPVTAELSINDVVVAEGNPVGTTTATFTVTLSEASGQNVIVDFATANASATAGSDYTPASGTLTFAPGDTTKTVNVTVGRDTDYENDETFTVNLSLPQNATVSDSQGIGTIENDDAVPALKIDDVTATEGNSGSKDFVFTVTKTGSTELTATVDFTTANGTAIAGSDYTTATGTLTFAPGDATKTVTVSVTGDTTLEEDQTFLVNLSNPTQSTISDSQGTGTIENDDAVPALTINDVSATEGNSGTKDFVFTVTKTGSTELTATVDFTTANGTAIAGSDYTTATGTLTFAPGDATKTVTVSVTGDTTLENDETFFVNLSAPSDATISDSQGTGTIQNDDIAPALTINDVSATEGNSGTKDFVFTVTKTGSTELTATVDFTTANGTAIAGSDYTTATGTLTFAPDDATKTVTVGVVGDTVTEAAETFFVNLSLPVNATISDSQGTGTINNDDVVPSFSINDVTAAEGTGGSTNFVFTVTKSGSTTIASSINFATANGTATEGSDYLSTSGVLNFSASDTVKTISVAINPDGFSEQDEIFFVNLSSPSNATISDSQGVGTIQDDEDLSDVTSMFGPLALGPDMSSWAPNRLDVFAWGDNDDVVHKYWGGNGWSDWESLGGITISDPSAVSWETNRIDVFVAGIDGALWHKWWAGTSWSQWESLGGDLYSGPDVSSWAPNRLDVFARGIDNDLIHKYWNGASWSAWESLGGVITSDPTAVSRADNRIDVFARGIDGALWTRSWTGTFWTDWTGLGGDLTSGADASSWASDRLDVFARGENDELIHNYWNGGSWAGWESLGGTLSSDPSAVSWDFNRIDLFVRGIDGAMYHRAWNGSFWEGWERHLAA